MLSALPTALPSADTSTSPARKARGRDQPTADNSGFARLMQQQSQLRQAQQRQLAQRQATPQPQAPAPPSANRQGASAASPGTVATEPQDETRRRSGSAVDMPLPNLAEMPPWLQIQRPLGAAVDGRATLDTGDTDDTGEPAADATATASQTGAVLAGAIATAALLATDRAPIDTPPGEAAASGQAAAKTGPAAAQPPTASPPAAAAAAWSASIAQRGASTDVAAGRRSPAADRDEPVTAKAGERTATLKGRGDSALRPLAETAHAEPAPAPGRTPGQADAFKAGEPASRSPGRDPAGPGVDAIGTLAGTAAASAAPFQPSGPAGAATLPAPAAADVPAQAQIPVPLDSPLFAPALGTQISLFARDGVQSAQLQLNPAEMGPISVQIVLDGQAARVDFQADLAATRQVIEASLPALASALQDAGLTLAGGGVFQQSPGRQDAGQGAPATPPRSGERSGNGVDLAAAAAAQRAPVRRGLVDLVA